MCRDSTILVGMIQVVPVPVEDRLAGRCDSRILIVLDRERCNRFGSGIWKTRDMNEDERAVAQDTILMLNVIRMALGRREEVFQIIEQAADESIAIARLAEMLDVEEHHCTAILANAGQRLARGVARTA